MICRLCLLESNEIFKIFEDDGVKLNIAEIVSKHFWFEPKIDDPISNIICNSCWWKIDSFHIFYLSVEQANKNFAENVAIKNEMKNSNFDNNDDQIMIKTEEKDNNESLKDDDDIDNDDDDDEDEDDGGNDDNKSNNDDVSENESGGANDSSSDSDYVNSTSSKRRRKSKENIIKLEPARLHKKANNGGGGASQPKKINLICTMSGTKRAPREDPQERLSGDMRKHAPEKIISTGSKKYAQRWCRVCKAHNKRGETSYICKYCIVPLHRDKCFLLYHTLPRYWIPT